MALTVDQLTRARDSLVEARAQGVRKLRDQKGEEIKYKSDGEMARALAALDSEIAAMASGPRSSTIRFTTSKGL
jgi:hypothetical protein